MSILKAPFPWFGGKSLIADVIWEWFGDVRNYVEPFAGSLAVLLGRPIPFDGVETVNDLDGFISNFWRAISVDPDQVARYADWPVNENDLHARHAWLVGKREDITRKLEGDPEWFDAKVAGWWVWGICCWIGSGWCSGKGPWHVVDGELINTGDAGQGVNRQLVHLGDAGQGVNRQLAFIGRGGQGINQHCGNLAGYFSDLTNRLRKVRVCCGDWSRVCGDTPTVKQGLTAVFLDPPYSNEANRNPNLYAKECGSVAHSVREWALEHGEDQRLRICLCGYEGEHAMPSSWSCVPWKAKGGYGSQSEFHDNPNAKRERLWFSPHCLNPEDAMPLFQNGSLSLG